MGELLQAGHWKAQERPKWLPDPAPFVSADVRAAIDSSGLTFEVLAERVNAACGITWVRPRLVERWHQGLDIPLCTHARVLWWLAGMEIGASVAQLLTG